MNLTCFPTSFKKAYFFFRWGVREYGRRDHRGVRAGGVRRDHQWRGRWDHRWGVRRITGGEHGGYHRGRWGTRRTNTGKYGGIDRPSQWGVRRNHRWGERTGDIGRDHHMHAVGSTVGSPVGSTSTAGPPVGSTGEYGVTTGGEEGGTTGREY